MESAAFSSVAVYSVVSFMLMAKMWRTDVYFATFLSLMVLYSLISQWSYYLAPELSEFIIRMYFGQEALIDASIFTTLSLTSLFFGYWVIYKPLTKSVAIAMRTVKPVPSLFILINSIYILCLLVGYIHFRDSLSYSNASNEYFLIDAGSSYTMFIQAYKFSVFIIIVMYAALRNKLLRAYTSRVLHIFNVTLIFIIFLAITIGLGSRTDPLALMLGIIGFEYFKFKYQPDIKPLNKQISQGYIRSKITLIFLLFSLILCTLAFLYILESSRNGSPRENGPVEISGFVQMVVLKDYFTPFHVLIGAMANDYVDPLAVLASNAANSLMFLGVDYLQAYVVHQWEPGVVTRTASPAMFAFTEGYVALGWAGFIYNGVVWSAGIALWRRLSRSNDQNFNAIAFALTIALAATVPRSQSMYFLKDIYLFFAPALGLYCIAAGLIPFGSRTSTRSTAQLNPGR